MFWFWDSLNKDRCIPTWWSCFNYETHKTRADAYQHPTEPLLDMIVPRSMNPTLFLNCCSPWRNKHFMVDPWVTFYLSRYFITVWEKWSYFPWVCDISGWNFDAEATCAVVSSTLAMENCVWMFEGFSQSILFMRVNTRNQTVSLNLQYFFEVYLLNYMIISFN